VTVWTQHSMETLTGDFRECTELFETNRCVDEISEDSFANSFFAAEVSIHRLRQQGLSKRGVTLNSRVGSFFEILGQTHSCPRLLNPYPQSSVSCISPKRFAHGR